LFGYPSERKPKWCRKSRQSKDDRNRMLLSKGDEKVVKVLALKLCWQGRKTVQGTWGRTPNEWCIGSQEEAENAKGRKW